jgi:pimeloyl-ACP methyl ester carboxylesterase
MRNTVRFLLPLALVLVSENAFSFPIDAFSPSLASQPWTCNGTTGLAGGLPACTAQAPCVTPTGPLAEPHTLPDCGPDGPARRFVDPVTGGARAACVFRPASADTEARPLVVFLHGSEGAASAIYHAVTLREKAAIWRFTGGSGRGFWLAALQGRNLHWPQDRFEGAHFDYFFRDLASPSRNADVASLDRLIDDLAAQPGVDPSRIYLVGWSNGATFAQMYAIARHERSTPGGHRVAAAAGYAGGDPFENLSDEQSPSCALQHYPTSQVPLMVVHRACDALAACDETQRRLFALPPGMAVVPWIAILQRQVRDPNVERITVDRLGQRRFACAAPASCSRVVGLRNHLAWPNGIADGSGIDWEADMLGFLGERRLR